MSSLTIRLMSANGKGFNNAAFTMLNSPVAAAIPTARETTAVAAKPGLRRKIRSAYRRSAARVSSKKFPQRRAGKNFTTRPFIDGDLVAFGDEASSLAVNQTSHVARRA